MISAVVSLRVWAARKLGDGMRGNDMGGISCCMAKAGGSSCESVSLNVDT
jgi:hypothetical protein